MNLKIFLSGVAVAALVALPIAQTGMLPSSVTAAQAAQNGDVSINIFFDALGDQGEWVNRENRYVWVRNNVDADWAPYTHGRWANTERYGWTFVSDEPFAWAVYHYGRWGYDQDIGWFWVPGTVWAPAWVSWRRSNDVVGWAPLPPEGGGYAVSIDVSSTEPPRGYWHFVPSREFLAPDLTVVIVHDESPYDQTEAVGSVVVENNIVVNKVIDVDFIRQASGQEVKTTEVHVVKDATQAEQARGQGAIVAVEGKLAKPAQDAAPSRVVEAKRVKAPTAGRDIETTTGSIKPGQQQPGTDQATGGQRAGDQAAPAAEPKAATPGIKPKVEGQDKAATGEQGSGGANGKPKVEGQNRTVGKEVTKRPEAGGSGVTASAPSDKKKPKIEQGAAQGEAAKQPDQAKQAEGATDGNGASKSAEKKLKKQPAKQSQDNASQDSQGASADQRKAAASQGQGAEGKGPRKLKSTGQEQPSQEKTGAINGAKAMGHQAEGAPAGNAEAAAPKAQGKTKGCSAEQQAAGSC